MSWFVHPDIPLSFAFALAVVAVGIDWRGVGDQWDRDRWAAVLAVPGWGGLLAGAGWTEAAWGHGRGVAALAGGLAVGSAATLAVTLLGGKRVPGRMNLPLWAAVLGLDVCLPATGRPVAVVLGWPWERTPPGVAALLMVGWACAFLFALGWRPLLGIERSGGPRAVCERVYAPLRALLERLERLGDVPETETETETETGHETEPVTTGRTTPWQEWVPGVWLGGAPVRPDTRARVTGQSWGLLSRFWKYAAGQLHVSDLPLDVPPAPLADQWLAKQLRRQADAGKGAIPTELIVREYRRMSQASRATAYRRIDRIRADHGLPTVRKGA